MVYLNSNVAFVCRVLPPFLDEYKVEHNLQLQSKFTCTKKIRYIDLILKWTSVSDVPKRSGIIQWITCNAIQKVCLLLAWFEYGSNCETYSKFQPFSQNLEIHNSVSL